MNIRNLKFKFDQKPNCPSSGARCIPCSVAVCGPLRGALLMYSSSPAVWTLCYTDSLSNTID